MKSKELKKDIKTKLEKQIQEVLSSYNKEVAAKMLKSIRNSSKALSKKMTKSIAKQELPVAIKAPRKPIAAKAKLAPPVKKTVEKIAKPEVEKKK
jgi:uncharacterized membrane-anchored protein YhcB (DUF1043 family)